MSLYKAGTYLLHHRTFDLHWDNLRICVYMCTLLNIAIIKLTRAPHDKISGFIVHETYVKLFELPGFKRYESIYICTV